MSHDLLVGHGTSDDAAVLKIDGERALVQTVDFFTPIVDDPRLFGAIAAANSISDIYAMGAEPIIGLAIAAFPSDKLPLSVLEDILGGGAEKAAEAGFAVAGGHTIIDDVPKYGLAVTGMVAVKDLVRNSTASAGDHLYLTKPIGNGILICAHRARSRDRGLRKLLRRGSATSIDEAVHWMLMLNRDVARVMVAVGVSAATDITGYGLVGHLLEMTRGAGVGATINFDAVPILSGAREGLQQSFYPEGSHRNAMAFRARVRNELIKEEYQLLCDAQTSGGLLIAVSPEKDAALSSAFEQKGLFYARIGRVTNESDGVRLTRRSPS